MLAKVIKPDHTAVTYRYDALGRRVEKQSNEKTTTFIWDGNTIFHEYFSIDGSEKSENKTEDSPQPNPERPANLITWVFNDGFVPSAKLTNEGNYSIISDYLGTPVEAYDEQGQKVWSAELDIYGRVNEFTGEQDFIPFRYQGQYEDVEIGLYYNRFRYYDPAQGNYTQVDPIGLAGGNPTLYGYVGDPNNQMDPFGLNPFRSVRAALRYAKELTGIPRSQQPIRQWTVGSDYTRRGYENYKVSNDKGSHGRYYEFVNDYGEKKVTVLHNNDPNRDLHAHAGMHKGPVNDPKRFTYDFKEERYAKIHDPKTKDHHLDIKCK